MTEDDIKRLLEGPKPRPVPRANPVGMVLIGAGIVALLATGLALLT